MKVTIASFDQWQLWAVIAGLSQAEIAYWHRVYKKELPFPR